MNIEPKSNNRNNHMSCRNYFMAGGFVGLLGVIIAFLGLVMAASGSQNPDPPSPTIIAPTAGPPNLNVTGNWEAIPNNGFTYRFQQNGDFLTIEEMAPNGIVTSIGNGTIIGGIIDIEYAAADGSVGSGNFNVSPNGDQMTGSFTNYTIGSQIYVDLYRR